MTRLCAVSPSLLAALKQSLALRSSVLRDGEMLDIEARELVPGDIVSLRAGALVPADVKYCSAIPPGIRIRIFARSSAHLLPSA